MNLDSKTGASIAIGVAVVVGCVVVVALGGVVDWVVHLLGK
jgi:hypothetical protein